MNKIKRYFTKIVSLLSFFLFSNGALAQFAQDRMMTKYGPASDPMPLYGPPVDYVQAPFLSSSVISVILQMIYTVVLPLAILVWLVIGVISLMRKINQNSDKKNN